VSPFKSCPREQTPRVKAKVFYLQNPITALKIYLKFLEVKQHWDPNLEKSEFLEGKQNYLDTRRSWKILSNQMDPAEIRFIRKVVINPFKVVTKVFTVPIQISLRISKYR
jgi:hypothetical protein